MKGSVFKKLAENSHSFYDQDNWIFIRELVQNSRDSGCDKIEICAFLDKFGYEIISVNDNGSGMSKLDVENFLFRLYSSSKESESNRVGMFGVGFWTVLRFNPLETVIESVKGNQKVGVTLDNSLNIQPYENISIKEGTKIGLKRLSVFEDEASFLEEVKHAVERYCKFATGIGKKNLTVMFNGKSITESLSLPEKGYISFNKGELKGVVGFSKEPQVVLMKGGIPLWKGRILEELKEDFSDKVSSYSGPGIAPVFLLDGNGFESVISRKKVKQTRYLKYAVNTAEKALAQLLKSYSRYAFPGKKKQIFYLTLMKAKLTEILKSRFFLKKAGYFVVGAFFLFLLGYFFLPVIVDKYIPSEFSSFEPYSESIYQGAVIESGEGKVSGFSYTPMDDFHFTLFKADFYSIEKGFLKSDKQIEQKGKATNGRIVKVSLQVSNKGKFFLPVPEGGVIVPESFRLNGKGKAIDFIRKSGGYLASIPFAALLSYNCIIIDKKESMDESDMTEFKTLPDTLQLPSSLSEEISNILKGKDNEKLKKAIELTYIFCKPLKKKSSKTGVFNSSKPWVFKVIEAGEGDCDVINGFLVLILRKLDIPARLVIGFVGENGKAVSGYHAWTEYYSDGWKSTDLSEPLIMNQSFEKYTENKENVGKSSTDKPNFGKSVSHYLKNEYNKTVISSEIFLLVFSVCLLILIYMNIKLFKKKIVGEMSQDEMKSILAKMLVRVVLQPKLWSKNGEIHYQKVIPAMNGKLYSLNDLKLLASLNRLFAGTYESQWSKKYLEKKYVVFDKKDKFFRNVISIVHGVVDLDKVELFQNELFETEKDNEHIYNKLNKILNKILKGKTTVIFSNRLKRINLQDFELPFIDDKNMLSGKIIVVNKLCNEITDILNKYKKKPLIMMFKLGDFIIRQSVFSKSDKNRYLKILAERLLLVGEVYE